jgi:hypothetical protein
VQSAGKGATSQIVAKFGLISRVAGEHRNAHNGFESDEAELPVIALTTISTITGFDWIKGGELNLIIKTENVKM